MSLPALIFRLLKGGSMFTPETGLLCLLSVMDPDYRTISTLGFRTVLILRRPRTP